MIEVKENETPDDYISEYETTKLKFIWGLKSWCDITPSTKANLYSMNDIDLIYLKDEQKYILGLETFISFDSGYDDEKKYLKELLRRFTDWMIENNYSIDKHLGLYQVFSCRCDVYDNHFDSIEDAYATFKLLVEGY
jgi:hypothetical protein